MMGRHLAKPTKDPLNVHLMHSYGYSLMPSFLLCTSTGSPKGTAKMQIWNIQVGWWVGDSAKAQKKSDFFDFVTPFKPILTVLLTLCSYNRALQMHVSQI